MQKRMWKVIAPIEKSNGEKYWMRLGTGFLNKDDSINIYLDALPAPVDKAYKIQLREMTEEDFAQSREKRAAFQLPRSSSGAPNLNPPMANAAAEQSIPF